MGWIKGWIILWVGLFLWGCATTGDVQTLKNEIYKLDLQLNQIQKEKDSIKNDLEFFGKVTQQEISTLRTENKKLQADLFLRLETLQSELRTLSTGVEEYKEFFKRPSKDVERVREDAALRTKILEERFKRIDDRIKGLEGKVVGLVPKQLEVKKTIPPKEASVEIKGVSTRPRDLYMDAYQMFRKGDLEGARREFEAFLKQYPNNELSDNAQFWIGETYYLKKDFKKAILEYEKAISKYPEGDKISAALFKQALAFLELGDKTDGRDLLKRVIERYPHSDQAEMAKKRLEGIK